MGLWILSILKSSLEHILQSTKWHKKGYTSPLRQRESYDTLKRKKIKYLWQFYRQQLFRPVSPDRFRQFLR